MIKKIFLIFSVLLLIYMLWPGPSKISQFRTLPDSAKSTLSGDTTQFSNITAYFSNHFRDFVTNFYYKNFWEVSHLPFPPLKLNHPPEYAWIAINVNVDSTYLEEYIYPLRDSLFVNGFETHQDDGSLIFVGAPALEEANKIWYSKTTLRFYSSNFMAKIIVWLGIIIVIRSLYRLTKNIIKE